ncbi:hypothetical protein F4804DRAFT_178238 [Jackrogersella minutella]|nr:hypothetical protein F4804DRAFT_178238 [Jackrogersella minutella]
MKTAAVTSVLIAIIGLVTAVAPFTKDRDISVDTIGWNSSSPRIPRQPISPTAPLHLPYLTSAEPAGKHPDQDLPGGDHPKQADASPDDGAEPSPPPPYHVAAATTAEEQGLAMAGLAVAVGVAVVLLT